MRLNDQSYAQVQPSDAAEIVEEHIEKGNVVKRLALMELPKTAR